MYQIGDKVLFVANPLESYHEYKSYVGQTGTVVEASDDPLPYPYLVQIGDNTLMLSPEELEKAY